MILKLTTLVSILKLVDIEPLLINVKIQINESNTMYVVFADFIMLHSLLEVITTFCGTYLILIGMVTLKLS